MENEAREVGLLLTPARPLAEAVISDLDEKVLVALSRSFSRPPATNTQLQGSAVQEA